LLPPGAFSELKIYENAFAAGAPPRPGPRWGSLQRSLGPLAGFGGREGEGKEGVEGRRVVRREKKEGKKGRGGGGEKTSCAPYLSKLATLVIRANCRVSKHCTRVA